VRTVDPILSCMKKLLVYRHGEARKNTQAEVSPGVWEDVVGGRASDSPLTKEGIERHAVGVGRRILYLCEQGVIEPETTKFFSSTAVRARDTLRIACGIAGLQRRIKSIQYDFELEELDQGEWTNRPKSRPLVLKGGGTAEYVPLSERDLDYTVGGMETLRGVTERTMRALHRAADAVPEGGVGIVSGHGITTRLAAIAITGADILGTRMDFGAETAFVIDGQEWTVPYVGLPTHEPNPPLAQAMWHA
jgi:broad specificity phosphatase PhoE